MRARGTQFSMSSCTSRPPSLSSIHIFPGAPIEALTLGEGDTGNIDIQSGQVTLTGGAQISSSSGAAEDQVQVGHRHGDTSRSSIEETGIGRRLPLLALPIVDGSFGEALLDEHCGTLLPQRGILRRSVDQLGERCNGVIPDTSSGIEAG
jgi:hypothetical protein